MPQNQLRKVFISYYHNDDDEWKRRFAQKAENVIIDKSVDTGDIDDANLNIGEIRRRIRDDYIATATVTIVLIGPRTWQRKHVDWEIASSISHTDKNSRCGLLGILLPNHPNYGGGELKLALVPPRLADNCGGDNPYAMIYNWPKRRAPERLREWIDFAFLRSKGPYPDNSSMHFARNRTSDYAKGWIGKGQQRTLSKRASGVWE